MGICDEKADNLSELSVVTTFTGIRHYGTIIVQLERCSTAAATATDVRAKTDARHARSGSSSERNLNSTAKCRPSTLDVPSSLYPTTSAYCQGASIDHVHKSNPLSPAVSCVYLHISRQTRGRNPISLQPVAHNSVRLLRFRNHGFGHMPCRFAIVVAAVKLWEFTC